MKVEGGGLPSTKAFSQSVLARLISTRSTCGLRLRKKSASSSAKSSMHSALLSRGRLYTVFFIVSVGKIALLSPAVKQVSKSPESNTSTFHSFTVCKGPSRFTFMTRTLDFPYKFSARAITASSPYRSCSHWDSEATVHADGYRRGARSP